MMLNAGKKKSVRRGHSAPSGWSDEENASGVIKVGQSGVRSKRCVKSNFRKTPIDSGFRFADGFLKTQFIPRKSALDVPVDAEADLLRSLSMLCEHYQFQTQVSDLPFPHNITDYLCQLRGVAEDHPTPLYIDVRDKSFVAVEKCEDTDRKLYYIGIEEVATLFDKRHPAAKVLLGIFCYLYYSGVSYHGDEGTFLYWHYELLGDTLEDDVDDSCDLEYEEYLRNRAEFYRSRLVTENILSKISAFKRGPETLGKALKAFKPEGDIERSIHELGQRFNKFSTKFPEGTFDIFKHTNVVSEMVESENDEELNYGTVITLDKTVSFIHNADMDTWLSGCIESQVNIDFQDCWINDFPTVVRTFNDDTDYKSDNLDFEFGFFELLDQLIDVLFQISKDDGKLINIL